jgi:hypothetical protein
MGSASGRAGDVLAQLDQASADFQFPDLSHGYYYAVDARLHAFGDPARWALVIEAVGHNPRAGNLVDVIQTFGNCLTSGAPGYGNEDFHDRIDNMDDVESRDEPESYLGAAPLVVRGHAIRVGAAKGEELSATFRRLVPAHRDLLFGDDAGVRRRLRRPDSSSLRPVLMTPMLPGPRCAGVSECPARSRMREACDRRAGQRLRREV